MSDNHLRDEARACWDAINALVDPDKILNGTDAERAFQAGLVKACNTIFDRAYWDRDKPQIGGAAQ